MLKLFDHQEDKVLLCSKNLSSKVKKHALQCQLLSNRTLPKQ
jgi:hypothetical protein